MRFKALSLTLFQGAWRAAPDRHSSSARRSMHQAADLVWSATVSGNVCWDGASRAPGGSLRRTKWRGESDLQSPGLVLFYVRCAKLPAMPLQNRVTPFGTIIATPERGTMLGNRGILHNAHKEIVRTSQVRRWLICVLEFKCRRRTIMKPGSYTELFFLDEATALAAGHRPCCECRRKDYKRFQDYWQKAFRIRPTADQMDQQLQQDRREKGKKKTYQTELKNLPDGTFIAKDNRAWLIWNKSLWLWSPKGYTTRLPIQNELVTVLTPEATVNILKAGYLPLFHPSLITS